MSDPVRTILEPHVPGIGVMSFNELVRDVDVRSAGLVHLPREVEIASTGVVNSA